MDVLGRCGCYKADLMLLMNKVSTQTKSENITVNNKAKRKGERKGPGREED